MACMIAESKMCRKSVRILVLTDFWHILDEGHVRNLSEFDAPTDFGHIYEEVHVCKLYHKYVRNTSEVQFWHISDTFLRKHWLKCFLNNVSENCQNLTSDIFLTVFGWQCFIKCFLWGAQNVSEVCQKILVWQISDIFMKIKPTYLWQIYKFCYIFDRFLYFPWHFSDTFFKLTHFCQKSDIFRTDFWHIFETDSFLTVFRQFSDTFLKIEGPQI